MDVVIIGAGIMGATLGALLTELEPHWHVTVVERLPEAGQESSHAWHNSGTGHAGLCEFNYTPRTAAGIDVTPAIRVAGTADAAFLARADELTRIVHDEVAALDGSISAEHGLGQSKNETIARYKPAIELSLMREIKGLLDPAGRMNPGKVLPTS